MESVGIGTIAFLVLFPALMALLQLFVRNDRIRTYLTVIGALLIAFGSIFCALQFLGADTKMFVLGQRASHAISMLTLLIDVVLCVYVIGKGLVHRKYVAVLLAIVQLALALYLDLAVMQQVDVAASLYIDNLSVIMALIIGIIGSVIIVYGLGYMRDHEAHADGPDRRPVFFSLMFVFLGAMFGVIFSNELTWMLCAWEVTTVCSFALIGYTRTEEATDNAFLQITLNLIGGISFSIALIWIGSFYDVNEFDQFISLSLAFIDSGYSLLVYIPILLLALAGFVKAAQMPFQNWLLGAMVAPTPTSALLHSSTMVKAGVFLLIKLAPLLGFNIPGYIVMLVGGVTFLFAALAAISQSNAKRVLAYSTISNLGLITACAGIGTDGAIWAAIFLLIFHAAAKSLLFCCVGTAEHHIGSRDIEDMDNLFERMPRLSRFMGLGILCMFIAPFGMLVSKWAALQSFAASENVLLLLILAFGSAATFMFWAKWLGKILSYAHNGDEDVEQSVSSAEWASLSLMTIFAVGCCICFPLISSDVVVPYLETLYGGASAVITGGDLWICSILALVIGVIILGFSGATKKKVVPVYMAGATVHSDQRTFSNSFGNEMQATQRNWYMEDMFGEGKMKLIGGAIALTLIIGSLVFCVQEVAANEESLDEFTVKREAYQESSWAAAGYDVMTYVSIWDSLAGSYYGDYGFSYVYEMYADEINEQAGISSEEEYLALLMEDYFTQVTSSSDSDTDTDTETDADADESVDDESSDTDTDTGEGE